MVSFMSVAPVPGAPQPVGAMGAALSNLCLSVDEHQPSWIKGAQKCGQLIKAHQLPYVVLSSARWTIVGETQLC